MTQIFLPGFNLGASGNLAASSPSQSVAVWPGRRLQASGMCTCPSTRRPAPSDAVLQINANVALKSHQYLPLMSIKLPAYLGPGQLLSVGSHSAPGTWQGPAGRRPAGGVGGAGGRESVPSSVSRGGSVLCASEVPSFLTRGSSIVCREEESVASGLRWCMVRCVKKNGLGTRMD